MAVMNIKLPDGSSVSMNNPFLEGTERAKQIAANRVANDAFSRDSLGKATYGWANAPLMDAVEYDSFNAKNMPYQSSITTDDGRVVNTGGLALKNYGWNESNIIDKINFSRDKWRAGDKSGGYREIFMKMGNWADQYSPELRTYLDTGRAPAGLNMDTVLQAADYGLRGLAQKQQNKNRGFFKKMGGVLKDNLGVIIGASAAMMIPGAAPYAAYAAAAGNIAQKAEAGEIDDPWDVFESGYEGYQKGRMLQAGASYGSNKWGSGDLAKAINQPTKTPKLPSKKVMGVNVNPADVAYFTGKGIETYDAFKDYREQVKQQQEAIAQEQEAARADQQAIQQQQGALAQLPSTGLTPFAPASGRFAARFQRYG